MSVYCVLVPVHAVMIAPQYASQVSASGGGRPASMAASGGGGGGGESGVVFPSSPQAARASPNVRSRVVRMGGMVEEVDEFCNYLLSRFVAKFEAAAATRLLPYGKRGDRHIGVISGASSLATRITWRCGQDIARRDR